MTMQQPAGSRAISYPDSDGKPLAEKPLHRDELMRCLQTLQDAFADRPDVYISGNVFLYYREGDLRASISPDIFVVVGIPKLPEQDTYRVWEEGRPPTFVFEIASASTRREDQVEKRDLYARIGVAEYVLYDPLAEYLRPALQAFRLVAGTYEPMPAAMDGAVVSEALDLRLRLVGGRLQLFRATGERLLSTRERLDAAEARMAVLEAELKRLREDQQ